MKIIRNTMAVLLFAAQCTISFTQIPAGYYGSAEGKTGEQLKAALYEIIKGHVEYPYTASTTDTWDILKSSDRDPENAENVILIYTNRSVNGPQEYNNAQGWTREHVWAKSRGDFGTSTGTGTDLHNLKPCDVSMNSLRSNRSFAASDNPVDDNGIFTGCYVGDGFTFEPRDAVKGDVARIIFYMATRYEGYNGEPDLELTEQVLDSGDKSPLHGVLSDLLSWNDADPVDAFEENRNNVIYSYQQNRNPFIDHPEWINAIWGTATKIQNTFTLPENNQIEVYDLSGRCVYKGERNPGFRSTLIPNSIYIIKDSSGIHKIIIQNNR
ncbi:endonuclease [Saccharicrinis sp. FJH54]|uniref:endonuclease n=1 Tax=Saccharicrinis sp. FJH54 TaxID=3344665 RepID=UPI0035D45389